MYEHLLVRFHSTWYWFLMSFMAFWTTNKVMFREETWKIDKHHTNRFACVACCNLRKVPCSSYFTTEYNYIMIGNYQTCHASLSSRWTLRVDSTRIIMHSLWWVQIVGYIWLADRIRLFVHYTISLSSMLKFIWRHWTYKMRVRYILSSV